MLVASRVEPLQVLVGSFRSLSPTVPTVKICSSVAWSFIESVIIPPLASVAVGLLAEVVSELLPFSLFIVA